MSHRNSTLCAIVLALAVVSGCDDQPEEGQSVVFDGDTRVETEGGAFSVELWSEVKSPCVGSNTFVLRVCMADTEQGIPNAEIGLEAWMPRADGEAGSESAVTYLGDGQYRIENVELGQGGAWQFDFSIEVGATMRESVAFRYEVL